jgi:NAD(P)-dependent dehydrogenase (short-subunit alcohol dehydrogenase family)
MTRPERVALVTGASRGLGREIARQLAARGLRVVAACRDPGDAAPLLHDHDLGGSVVAETLDVADPEAVERCVARVVERFGRVDVLVNNAGISDGDQSAVAADPGLCERVWRTNVAGAWSCASAVVPVMREHGYGRIVNVSSTMGSLARMTSSSEPAYRVSKAALNALTRVLAAELAGTGILVNAASPGWVRTDLGGPHALRDVTEGADTPVWLATLPDGGPSGGYFLDREPLAW